MVHPGQTSIRPLCPQLRPKALSLAIWQSQRRILTLWLLLSLLRIPLGNRQRRKSFYLPIIRALNESGSGVLLIS